jgi:FlaA1/EpsC-like NDP-sugar epimerase
MNVIVNVIVNVNMNMTSHCVAIALYCVAIALYCVVLLYVVLCCVVLFTCFFVANSIPLHVIAIYMLLQYYSITLPRFCPNFDQSIIYPCNYSFIHSFI